MSSTLRINRNGVLTGCLDPDPELIIPEGVKTIGERVFKNVAVLEKVSFPASLVCIRTGAFRGCTNLKEVTFSNGLQKIEGSVFRETGLVSAVLPEGLTELGSHVFADCKALTHMVLPASLTTVGTYCFCGCGVQHLTILGGPPLQSGMFIGCETLAYVDTPDISPAKLPRGPVKNAAVLTFVQRALQGETLPNHDIFVSYIRKQRRNLFPLAVEHDVLLQFLLVQKMLTAQDVQTLLQLAESNVPVTAALLEYQNQNGGPPDPFEIAEKEFARAERIAAFVEKNGTLPVSELKKIWSWKKQYDGSLCITSYKGSDPVVVVPDKIGNTPVTALEHTFDINNYRHTAAISDVTLPLGLTKIGSYTFFGCGNLQEVTIPVGVKTIGSYAFAHSGLHYLIVPEGVQRIEPYAFTACSKLRTLVLPNSLMDIGGYGDYDICNGSTVIHAPAGSFAENYAKNNHIKFKPI